MISIILPCYNCQDYIGQAVDSVLGQSYTDWELLVVDDGSTDGSRKVIEQHAAGDPRIRVFSQPNGGVSKARNMALANARGEFIALLDADDWLPQDSLKIRMERFRKSPATAFVDGRVDVYCETGSSIERSWKPEFRGNPHSMLLRSREGGSYDYANETVYCYRNRSDSAMKDADGLAEGYRTLRKIFTASHAFRTTDRLIFEYKIRRIMFLTYIRSGNIAKALRYLIR